MAANRIRRYYGDDARSSNQQKPSAVPSGFVEIPLAQLPAAMCAAIQKQQHLYELAYRQARAAAADDAV